jgi:hypothetical protein
MIHEYYSNRCEQKRIFSNVEIKFIREKADGLTPGLGVKRWLAVILVVQLVRDRVLLYWYWTFIELHRIHGGYPILSFCPSVF